MMAKIVRTYGEALDKYHAGATVYGAFTMKQERARLVDNRAEAVWAEVVTDVKKIPAEVGDKAEAAAKSEIQKRTGAKVTEIWYDP